MVLAVTAGVLLPQFDASIDQELSDRVTAYLFSGGAEAARSVLQAVAGSMITVTSLTFSLTVVTLQLASGQFSPRLLRTFSSDRFVQGTLALFLATFIYSLTVLRTVRSDRDNQVAFVPQISVTVSFALAVASVVGLVLFLSHLAREIRVETMIQAVHRDASATLRRSLPKADRDDAHIRSGSGAVPIRPANAVVVRSTKNGFLVRVDESELLAAAIDADAVIVVERAIGAFLVEGVPIALMWPRASAGFDDSEREGLAGTVSSSFATGIERTAAQDIGFGLRQLTDVAVKALSPGVNDPTTAVHVLGHSSALLCELINRDLGPLVLLDDDDRARVALSRPTFAELLELAVSEPRRYGAADPGVLGRLFQLLWEVACVARTPEHREPVADQLARLRATAEAQSFDATERGQLTDQATLVADALAGTWRRHRL